MTTDDARLAAFDHACEELSLRADDFNTMSDDELGIVRDDLFSDLLSAFPGVEAPDLAAEMDEALHRFSFPFDRYR